MLRFTIRDVLWLTVVVALAVGWWAERWNAQRLKGENMLLKISHTMMSEAIETLEGEQDAHTGATLAPIYASDLPMGESATLDHP
jgi:hypothetical protein